MLKIQKNEIPLLQFQHLNALDAELFHCISTRQGGISQKPFDTLNMGLHVNDVVESVIQNREILAEAVQIPLEDFCFANQTHGSNIYLATQKDKGKGILDDMDSIRDTDAFITNEKGIFLTILSADCVSILLYDIQNKVIAAIHAGWKGTVNKIAVKTMLEMQGKFGSKPENILVGIGPSISPQQYEVGKEVEEAVLKSFGTLEKYMVFNEATSKYHFDLWYSNQKQLEDIGIPSKNIETARICTFEEEDLLFSSRKGHGKTGRFATGIMLR